MKTFTNLAHWASKCASLGTINKKRYYLFFITMLLTLGVTNAWAETKIDKVSAIGFAGVTTSGYTAAGTDYSAVANTTNNTSVTYAMQVFDGKTGAVRGNKSGNANFSCRNTTTCDGYYISKVVLTVTGGTLDGATNNRSVVYFGTSAYANPTTAPTGTSTKSAENATGTTLTWNNTNEEASYFILYNLKTSGTLKEGQITITWTKKSGGDDSGSTTPVALSAPTNLQATNIAETSATLSWNTVANATGYSVTINGSTQDVTTTSYEATGLTAETAYNWSVLAKGDGTNFTNSTAATATFTTLAAQTGGEEGGSNKVTYDFTKIESFSSWNSSYSKREVTYSDAKVTFASACRQTSTITNQPITKGQEVSLVMTDGSNLSTVEWKCTQWSSKTQTITLHYSTNGGNTWTKTNITSTNFTISSDNLPEGTDAVKITFSSTSNQIGITSCTITKVEAAAETAAAEPIFSLPEGTYETEQTLTLTCPTADAVIYYSTDGATFNVYSTPITLNQTTTVKAYATKAGLDNSQTLEYTYIFTAPADVILDFTTNTWGLPSGSSNKVTTEASYTDGTYTVFVAGTNGHYFDTNNLITGKQDAYIILPIFDRPIVKVVCEGVSTGSGSVQFNLFIEDEAVSTAVTSCKVDQTFLIAEDKQAANVAHVIKVTNANNLRVSKIKIYLGEAPAVENPVIAGEEEFVTSTQVSITCTTSGAKIYYTTDGTTPTTGSTLYTAPFELSATTTVKAIAYADGQASAVVTKTFTFIETITCVQASEIALAQSENNLQTEKKYRIIAYVTETLSGVSSNQQSFKVVDNIGDESVFQSYYCNVPEAMAAGMKVEMIGKLSKYNTTAQMKNGDVTILEKPVAAPKILGVEAFETSTEVTITAEEGMQIYYTLDGTTPTTGSTLYTAPFELSATTTVKAFAYNSATAKSSTVVEKTFTKTTISTKTIDEFIASEGGTCYLEGIVSNITNTTYGNFDLTDETGTIYIYGCLNANGESKKFAELEVKEGDKIKVIADAYELYQGTKHEAKNVQYVSHKSAATIEVSNITMEVGETQTIAATITPAAAETAVVYTIKENTANAISLSGNTITANAVGTATITATIATAAEYMGKTVDFTVTVTPESTSDEVVILAELDGKWYAMKGAVPSGKSNQLDAIEVTYFNGTLYNVPDEVKASITWTRSVVEGKATFVNNGKYLKGGTSTDLNLAGTVDNNCKWMWNDENGYYTTNTSGTIRTFLYRENYNFKNYGASQAGKEDANGNYSELPVVTVPVYATGDITYTRNVTNKYGTICLPYASASTTGAIFYRVAGKEEGSKVYLESVDALEAGVPYIFEKTANTITVTCQGEAVAEAGTANGLVGTFTEITVPDGDYILYNDAFCTNEPAGTLNKIRANRAYLNLADIEGGAPTQMPGRRYIGMSVQGENGETGFENITVPAGKTVKAIVNGQLIIIRDGEMYNAQGQKL